MEKKTLDFCERIEQFVQSKLSQYIPENLADKVIHDTIWGSVVYYGWENQIIDSPLFQRLRDIRQLGMAEMTYPAARHTRFEHSLGTVAIASRMIDKLAERSNGEIITKKEKYMVRLAALLHDVGHCFYSHLSENVYGNLPEFAQLRNAVQQQLDPQVKPKPHELFSYMIIRSEAFLSFFYQYINYPQKGTKEDCRALLHACANMVVGQKNVQIQYGQKIALTYLTDILNSDFDADKLDYTQRDSYTSGIALTYGIERFLMKIMLCRQQTADLTEYRMAITSDAVTTVEELIFNRNMLYVYMYRHQKVLAVEAVVRDIIQGLIRAKKLSHPCDFLNLTDADIALFAKDTVCPFEATAPNRTLGHLVTSVQNRALPKRIFELKAESIVLSNKQQLQDKAMADCIEQMERTGTLSEKTNLLRTFLTNFRSIYSENAILRANIKKFTDILGFQDYEKNLQLRKQLYEKIAGAYRDAGKPVDFDIFDLYIVFPAITGSKAQFPVVSKQSETPEVNQFIYIKEWSEAFNLTNWRGYVFASTKIDKHLAEPIVADFIKTFNPDVSF